MTNSRRTILDITYNHQNITNDIKKHVVDWTYTDNLSGAIDDFQVILEDIDKKWISSWFPSKGDTIDVSINKINWTTVPIKTRLGEFEVDEIEASGPPTIATIKALAVPESNSIRGEFKTKAWEKVPLKKIAQDIAKANKMKLYFQTNENEKKDRVEQNSETDLEFLNRICTEDGLCLKISNKAIVILDEADYEAKAPVINIFRELTEKEQNHPIAVLNWSAKTTTTGIYKACRVEHSDSKKKKAIKATFSPPRTPKVGRILVVKEDVKNVAAAQKLAKKKLREANKDATTVQLTVVTEKHLDAGMTVTLLRFGKFDGKYIITQAVPSSSQMSLSLRRCLEGY